MIQCKNCGFQVNELMKFALMQNICPSCGKSLFSNADSNLISTFQSKILSERFSSKLTEELVYDIAMFMFNEFKHGLGKFKFNSEEKEKEEDVDLEELDIRKEIEAEYSEELEYLEGEDEPDDREVYEKTEKLKKLHQQRLIQSQANEKFPENKFAVRKQGQRVSRIS